MAIVPSLVPSPRQVVAAAGNLAKAATRGGLADLRPMPSTRLAGGEWGEVHRYDPLDGVAQVGDPVLLVASLAAPASAFDLRRGCSLVEHLLEQGRPTYLVEHGTVPLAERGLGLARFVDQSVPAAIQAAADDSGRPVHLVAWSLGGVFALLVAADRHDLPIASVTTLGTPVDVTRVPIVAPMRPLLDLTHGHGPLTVAYKVVEAVPTPMVDWAFQLASVQRMVTRPAALALHLDDADYLAQIEAVERFQDRTTAYPGRTFGQLYHRFLRGNALAAGSIEVGPRSVHLADVEAPVLVVAGTTDSIATTAAVQPLTQLLTGAAQARLELVPGGHLGLLTGRGARTSTWPVLLEWLAENDGAAPKRRAKRPSRTAIGANPTRRYGSKGSRGLAT